MVAPRGPCSVSMAESDPRHSTQIPAHPLQSHTRLAPTTRAQSRQSSGGVSRGRSSGDEPTCVPHVRVSNAADGTTLDAVTKLFGLGVVSVVKATHSEDTRCVRRRNGTRTRRGEAARRAPCGL